MINWELSKQGIRSITWPYRGLKGRPIEVEYFWSYPLTNCQFQMIAGSSLFFPMIHIKYVVCMSLWPRTIRILISNWPRTRKLSQFFKSTGGEDLILPWSRVGHVLRPIFILWFVKIWQVSSCGKIMQHLVYFDSWSWQSFVSNSDVFNCLFPLDIQNEIQLLSRVFCYSWLFVYWVFVWEMGRFSKFDNSISDGIVFVFHLA